MVEFDLHICFFQMGGGKKPPSRVVFCNHGMGWIPSLKLTARTWTCMVLKMKFLLGPGPFSGARWWFQIFFIFTPIWGKWTHFDKHIFQMGWNHQPGCFVSFREFWMFLVAQLFFSVGSHQVVFPWEFQGARHPGESLLSGPTISSWVPYFSPTRNEALWRTYENSHDSLIIRCFLGGSVLFCRFFPWHCGGCAPWIPMTVLH